MKMALLSHETPRGLRAGNIVVLDACGNDPLLNSGDLQCCVSSENIDGIGQLAHCECVIVSGLAPSDVGIEDIGTTSFVSATHSILFQAVRTTSANSCELLHGCYLSPLEAEISAKLESLRWARYR